MTNNEAKDFRALLDSGVTTAVNENDWQDFIEYCNEHPKFCPEVIEMGLVPHKKSILQKIKELINVDNTLLLVGGPCG